MKPDTHQRLTELAINMCGDISSSRLQQIVNKRAVIQGSVDEDEKDLLKRITNWHFYRSEQSPIPKKIRFIFKTTSEDILKTRIKEFMSTDVSTPRHFNWFGRIVHHIQDMCTPSHVIPIFHGPKLPFSSIGTIHDYFEDFLNNRLNEIETNSSIIKELSIDDINSFEGLYQTAAKEMLDLLQKQPADCENLLPFSMFWKNAREEEFEKIKGFGVYGECHSYFDRKITNNDDEDPLYDSLLSIQKMVTDQAIKHTCKALLFATKKEYI